MNWKHSMPGDWFRRRTRSRIYWAIQLASMSAALIAMPTLAAQQEQPLTFEVATIRPSDPNRPHGPSLRYSPGRFEAADVTLYDLIAVAYNLTYGADQQLSGGPDWARTEKFDVAAKEDEAVAKHLSQMPVDRRAETFRLMLQKLLSDRFALQVHRGTKELATYDLVVTKGGPKLRPAVLEPHLPANIPQNRINVPGKGHLEGHHVDMALLVKMFSTQPEIGGRTVVDKTGLKGKYDFTLRWAPEIATDAPGTIIDTPSSNQFPSFFTALQEQLGLRLMSARNPVEIVAVDRAEMPPEN